MNAVAGEVLGAERKRPMRGKKISRKENASFLVALSKEKRKGRTVDIAANRAARCSQRGDCREEATLEVSLDVFARLIEILAEGGVLNSDEVMELAEIAERHARE